MHDAPQDPPAPIGVYVHFPWCLSKCPYCDFVVYAAPRSAIDHAGYADAVIRELGGRATGLVPRRLCSIFVGGGTPSLWEPAQLARVLDAIFSKFDGDRAEVEVSLECDPSSMDYDRARALVDVGVNRLSIGVQALEEARLRFLGRIHTPEEAIAAVTGAVRAGTPRVSADLMYAVSNESPEVAALEATRLVELGVRHVSAYSLTIEPGTRFGQLARKGRLPLADDAQMAASFFAIDEALEKLGLEHYEVSNYAMPGERSRHNLGYWVGRDYLGLGCGAYGTLASPLGAATRYRNQPHPQTYVAATVPAASGAFRELTATEEQLDGPTRLRERIMLGLRMKDGFDLEQVALEVGAPAYPEGRREALERLEARGRLSRRGSQLSVPREAWIWVDDTAATLF